MSVLIQCEEPPRHFCAAIPITQRVGFGFASGLTLFSQQDGLTADCGVQQLGVSFLLGPGEQQQPPVSQVEAVAQPHTCWPHAFTEAAADSGNGNPTAHARYASNVTPEMIRRRIAIGLGDRMRLR